MTINKVVFPCIKAFLQSPCLCFDPSCFLSVLLRKGSKHILPMVISPCICRLQDVCEMRAQIPDALGLSSPGLPVSQGYHCGLMSEVAANTNALRCEAATCHGAKRGHGLACYIFCSAMINLLLIIQSVLSQALLLLLLVAVFIYFFKFCWGFCLFGLVFLLVSN